MGCFNLSGNSVYVLPDNGLQIEILVHSASIYSVVQAGASLIKLFSLYKNS